MSNNEGKILKTTKLKQLELLLITTIEKFQEENNEKSNKEYLMIEQVEKKLDIEIPKYNKYNENNPMKGISWNKSKNSYHVTINNIDTYCKHLDKACEKIIFNYNLDDLIDNVNNIIKKILSNNGNNIITYEYESKKYYDIQHILMHIGYKNANHNDKYNTFSNKIKFRFWHPNLFGGFILKELISEYTVKQIIHSSRGQGVVDLTKMLGIKIFNNKLLRKETICVNQIINIFNKEKYITQKSIGQYIIDLYFPDYKLAIECDEFNHINRNLNYEITRQKYIEKNLGATVLRFNPDDSNFNIFDVISKIHYHIVFKNNSL
jgi:very-short-patch-repair endonuclease